MTQKWNRKTFWTLIYKKYMIIHVIIFLPISYLWSFFINNFSSKSYSKWASYIITQNNSSTKLYKNLYDYTTEQTSHKTIQKTFHDYNKEDTSHKAIKNKPFRLKKRTHTVLAKNLTHVQSYKGTDRHDLSLIYSNFIFVNFRF